VVLGASLLGTPVLVAEPTGEQERDESVDPPSPTTNPEDGSVSLEFLEFLGEWETTTGEWVDPTEVESDTWPASLLDEDATNVR
jgi:hypothetical protein